MTTTRKALLLSARLCLCAAGLAVALAGCGQTAKKALVTGHSSSNAFDDAGEEDGGTADSAEEKIEPSSQPMTVSCEGASDGAPCNGAKHCIRGRCVVNTCGDHVMAGDEQCDDGNLVPGDGCDPLCHKEKPLCGDGHLDPAEECDDGNLVNDDGCSNICLKNVCGNGRVDLREECDDGNMVDDDACSNMCTAKVCGNGRIDAGEACDDGNKNDNDGCTNQCTIALCGNGITEGKEECDDGNTVDTDMCSSKCTANVCGNMRLDPGEICDGDAVGVMCVDCQQKKDVCRPCEDQNCTEYPKDSGVNVVADCYGNADMTFVQKCVDAVACARAKGCGYTPRGAEECYCGTATSSQCAQGKGINGPCKAEFEAAAGSTDYVVVTHDFGRRSVAIGAAVHILACDRDMCPGLCTPTPTM